MLYACRSWKDPEQLENYAFQAHFLRFQDDVFLLETFILDNTGNKFSMTGCVVDWRVLVRFVFASAYAFKKSTP